MTPAEQEYLEKLEQRVRDLERRRPSRLQRASLVLAPIVAVTLLTASVSGTGLPAVESRLLALESMLRLAPDGSAQLRGPFQVMDRGGKVVFSVSDRPASGAVNISRVEGAGPLLAVTGNGGKDAVRIGVSEGGHGRVHTYDSDGKLAGMLNEAGLNVVNTDGDLVAGVTRGKGLGRVVLWHDGGKRTAAELSVDEEGNGRVASYGKNGKTRAAMHGADGLGVYDDNENVVANVVSRSGRGVVGVGNGIAKRLIAELVADSTGGSLLHMKGPDGKTVIGLYSSRRTIALGNSSGKTVAEMTVHPSGYGLFQVWGGGNMPLALLGRSVDGRGGIVQISNGTTVTSSFTVSPDGNGYWQLNDASGTPVVEAGLNSGLGTVRAGPNVRCTPRPSSLVLPDCILGRK
jgi:hypothetical protein